MNDILSIIILGVTILLCLQGLFTIFWMIYAWENPIELDKNRSPQTFLPVKSSFTALIPAREEQNVISDTLWSISRMNYPSNFVQTIVICHETDYQTILAVQKAMYEIKSDTIQMVIYDGPKMTKPKALNSALAFAKGDFICIFDAEDEPHPDIYQVINTVIEEKHSDVVQSGVQLMNYKDNWFSTLNVLEYFFWFKSALHLFSKTGVTPLGGNTVFIKRELFEKIGGWDPDALTEDADIGIKLATVGAKVSVVYDEKHATQEETPPDLTSFIKQRTRWNQGFLQVLMKRDWIKIPGIGRKIFTIYILLSPIIQSLFFLYLPISLWLTITRKLSISVSLLSYVPFYLLILQVVILIVGLYEFTKSYKLKFSFFQPIYIIACFYPYQMILLYSSFRAIARILTKNGVWEKNASC